MSARPDFYSERAVRGRRQYACAYCRQAIERGAMHFAVAKSACGELAGWRAHVPCQAAATNSAASYLVSAAAWRDNARKEPSAAARELARRYMREDAQTWRKLTAAQQAIFLRHG